MPEITKIIQPPRRPNNRRIYIDGKPAFSLKLNIVAKLRLRVGMTISHEQIQRIESEQARQSCMNRALRILSRRMQSRDELKQKLQRGAFSPALIEGVLNDLAQQGYIDDIRFAQAKVRAAMQNKHHGPRRAMAELLNAGVTREVAEAAISKVQEDIDPAVIARQLALKHAPRLKKLEPHVARRRLIGLLQRRGFDYQSITVLVNEVLGSESEM
jgi:regulatory protein